MFLTMLKGKLHQATVTGADLHYEGSISIDQDLLDRAGILVNEQVDIYNINNGERFTTYAIAAARGSHEIGLNGAAARKAMVGDKVIICAYAAFPTEIAKTHTPTVVLLGSNNQIKE
jgi:aspartate 1-decarboxylase